MKSCAKHILIIDDEPSIRQTLASILEDEGYTTSAAGSATEGKQQLFIQRPDLIFLDIWMPEKDGMVFLEELMTHGWSNAPILMISGHGTIETAVKATKLGAFDFIEKPLELNRVLATVRNALAFAQSENQASKPKMLAGQSAAVVAIRETIKMIAPTTSSVLITGENGTGKEVVARMIVEASPRKGKPFIEVNCAAIPEELIESELFGYEKGAFTGAVAQKKGRFDLAHQGTLFLDEIGDMSLKTQAKILRILQEQRFERVGGTQTHTVDVRVLAATNKDLKLGIQEGWFREDLFYRLNVVRAQIPPLRDRKEDIPTLCEDFIREFSRKHARNQVSLGAEVIQALKQQAWPGNVRELRNVMERLVIFHATPEGPTVFTRAQVLSQLEEFTDSTTVEGGNPNASTPFPSEPRSLREARITFERDFILQALKACDYNVSKAAARLGMDRTSLYKRLKQLGIDPTSDTSS